MHILYIYYILYIYIIGIGHCTVAKTGDHEDRTHVVLSSFAREGGRLTTARLDLVGFGPTMPTYTTQGVKRAQNGETSMRSRLVG